MGEGQVEESGDVDAAKNVEVGEVGLGYNYEVYKRTFDWPIKSFPIFEEFQDSSWEMVFQKRDDTTVEDHEDCEEYEDTPDKVEIIA